MARWQLMFELVIKDRYSYIHMYMMIFEWNLNKLISKDEGVPVCGMVSRK